MGKQHAEMKRMGSRIRQFRLRSGMTQGELATQAGLSRSFVTRIENGTVEASFSSVAQLATVLGVSMAWIVGETKVPADPDATALRVLELAVRASRGVPVPVLGSYPVGVSPRQPQQGEVGRMVDVALHMLEGRDERTVGIVVVEDGSLQAHGFLPGSMILVDKNHQQRDMDAQVLVEVDGQLGIISWLEAEALEDLRGEPATSQQEQEPHHSWVRYGPIFASQWLKNWKR